MTRAERLRSLLDYFIDSAIDETIGDMEFSDEDQLLIASILRTRRTDRGFLVEFADEAIEVDLFTMAVSR